MSPDHFIIALLRASPDQLVRGKKRLQKLSYLLKEFGVSCEANFFLKDFGPFSYEISKAASVLTLFGQIDEQAEEVGATRRIVSVFRLASDVDGPEFDEQTRRCLNCLETFRTLELEIAATIRYFESCGFSPEVAEDKTRLMKPSKTKPPILASARRALNCIAVDMHGPRSAH